MSEAAPAEAKPRVERSDPFLKRLLAYADERFPVGPMLTVVVATLASTTLAASAALGIEPVWDLGLVALGVSYFLVVFLLRVLDEFKDYERDVVAYPERVLSRGVLTLDDMRRIGWVSGVLAAGCAAVLGVPALIAFAVVLVYGLLMAKEFFAGELLGKDVFVYAIVHQPINPLFTIWLYVAFATRLGVAPEQLLVKDFGYFVAALFLLGFGFEVSRKLWTPEEEKPGLVDSYSSHAIGPRGAGFVALVLLLLGTGSAAWFGLFVGLPAWGHVFFALCALLCVVSVGKFAWKPFPGASKKLQGAVGLGSLLVHVGIIAGLIAKYGAPTFSLWASGS